jgi:hypothetical protein
VFGGALVAHVRVYIIFDIFRIMKITVFIFKIRVLAEISAKDVVGKFCSFPAAVLRAPDSLMATSYDHYKVTVSYCKISQPNRGIKP